MPKHTDNSEAMRLADWHDEQAHGWWRAAEHKAVDRAEPVKSSLLRKATFHKDSAALIRQQSERIAELEAERDNLHTTMLAAAVEIQAHWDAHCDAEGYGPANLMHRLERGIASLYGYDAKTLQRVETERDQLRAEVERYHHLRNGQGWPAVFASHDAPEPIRGDELDTDIDAARTHKETE